MYMFRVYTSYWNGIIYSLTETIRNIFDCLKSFLFYSLPPLCLYMPAQKLTSPTCLSSEGPYAQSTPKPYKET